jgi:hypothetical protein
MDAVAQTCLHVRHTSTQARSRLPSVGGRLCFRCAPMITTNSLHASRPLAGPVANLHMHTHLCSRLPRDGSRRCRHSFHWTHSIKIPPWVPRPAACGRCGRKAGCFALGAAEIWPSPKFWCWTPNRQAPIGFILCPTGRGGGAPSTRRRGKQEEKQPAERRLLSTRKGAGRNNLR